jgi:hypothetical protein
LQPWEDFAKEAKAAAMKTKFVLTIVVLIGGLALISAGYCFWLMTVPLSYDWVPVVVIGFIVATGVFVTSLITSLVIFIRMRRSSCASNAPQASPNI